MIYEHVNNCKILIRHLAILIQSRVKLKYINCVCISLYISTYIQKLHQRKPTDILAIENNDHQCDISQFYSTIDLFICFIFYLLYFYIFFFCLVCRHLILNHLLPTFSLVNEFNLRLKDSFYFLHLLSLKYFT